MKDWKVLDEGDYISLDPAESGTNGNYVLVGSTGCGKTHSYIDPRLLETAVPDLVQELRETSFPDGAGNSLLIKKIKEENG